MTLDGPPLYPHPLHSARALHLGPGSVGEGSIESLINVNSEVQKHGKNERLISHDVRLRV